MSVFDDCRQIGSIEAAQLLGIKVSMKGRRGWALCPFHGETGHASFCLYEDSRGWYCYGCHAGGDAVKLYQMYLGVEPLEAARQLAHDYGIPVSDYDAGELSVNARHLETALEKRRRARLLALGEAHLTADEELDAIIRSAGMEAALDDPRFLPALDRRDRILAEQQQLRDATVEELIDWFARDGDTG